MNIPHHKLQCFPAPPLIDLRVIDHAHGYIRISSEQSLPGRSARGFSQFLAEDPVLLKTDERQAPAVRSGGLKPEDIEPLR